MIGLRFLSCVLFLGASSAMAAVTSEGEVIFDGDNVIVGQQEDGALTVTPPDGLALDSLTIAQNPGVVGTVLIDGAQISTQNELTIGWRGIGSLSVHNGGQLTQNTGFAYVGLDGVGKLEVQGSVSTADLTGVAGSVFFFIGGDGSNGGQGEVFVSQGAELVTGRATLGGNSTSVVLLI